MVLLWSIGRASMWLSCMLCCVYSNGTSNSVDMGSNVCLGKQPASQSYWVQHENRHMQCTLHWSGKLPYGSRPTGISWGRPQLAQQMYKALLHPQTPC